MTYLHIERDAAARGMPGRTCPASYGYAPDAFARAPQARTGTLFVAGGVYGNIHALARILARVASEPGALLIFNGDFHWFDADAGDFETIERGVAAHVALRGNVETEIAHDDEDAGCGCAYPQDVAQSEVDRSNAIIARLRGTARAFAASRARHASLPMHAVVEAAGMRVAVVHGDMESLAGWGYSEAALATPAGAERLRAHLEAARVRIVASSHTCLPVALTLDTTYGTCALVNNGAAGMPNFAGAACGAMTRISTRPAADALYRARIGEAHVEAITVDYDAAAWLERFVALWPPGSPAHDSYYERLANGPRYTLDEAARRGFTPRPGAAPRR